MSPPTSQAAITPGDPNNFITTWDTTIATSTFVSDKQIRISGSGSGYNYDLYWENTASSTISGTLSTTTSSFILTFPESGIYRVEIAGNFPRIYLGSDHISAKKILEVNQWGNIQWASMDFAFSKASNLRIPATDIPDLSQVTSMTYMFNEATAFNDPVNHWDVSGVTNMNSLFREARNFNQPLNNWNTASTTNMSFMFYNAHAFNQDISGWNTTNVTTIDSMFWGTKAFDQSINDWNVSNVTNMNSLFSQALAFNQSLDEWDTSRVTNMQSMFYGAKAFNKDISGWNTASTTNMSYMFRQAEAFNQPLADWDISSSVNMNEMFAFTQLSTTNLDTTLVSWAAQATSNSLTNRSLHIGIKSYSAVGASAIVTLQSLGWTISMRYSATYNVQSPATLTGTAFQVRDYNLTTNSVTVNIPVNCTFLGWSDGNASTTRSDVLTDNLEVTALVDCDPVSLGTFTIKQVIADEISLSIGSSLVLSPSIPGVTGGVSSGELPFNVKTNNALGYQVSLSFAQVVPFRHLLIPSSYIFNYVPQVVGVPDYEIIVPNKSYSFAYSVFSDNATQLFRHSGSTCGVGGSNTLGKCWFNQANARTPVTIVERNSPTSSLGATSTLQFKVVVDENPVPVLPSGEYGATVTVTVLPL